MQRHTGSDGTDTTSGGDTTKTTKTGSKIETVISFISNTATTTAQNALGTVTTSIQTLTEKVKDSAGNIKDRITETTTTGKEMVNGVATTFKQVETKVNGTVTKVTKTYDDMSKTLLGTFTNVSETTFNGITTKVQQAVEKYADGSEHIKKTVTETGQRIGENGAETYEKIITYIDGIQDKVTETSNLIDKSVKGTQNRIDQQLSEASGQLDKGIFGLVKSAFSDAKNGDWASLGLDFVNLIWGEVSQKQRDVISKWLTDALTAVNEGYSGGGISKALGSILSCRLNCWERSVQSLRGFLRFLARRCRNPMLSRPLLCLHSSRVYLRQRSLRHTAWHASPATCRPFLCPSGGAFVGALVLPAAASRTTGRTRPLPGWPYCNKVGYTPLSGRTA